MSDNVIYDKSKAFAIRIVNLYNYLRKERKENTIAKQLYRSGTSIGANVAESIHAQSKADFVNKLSIALKEADETCYWLELLYGTNYLSEQEYGSIFPDAEELVRLLAAIIKTTKENMQENEL